MIKNKTIAKKTSDLINVHAYGKKKPWEKQVLFQMQQGV